MAVPSMHSLVQSLGWVYRFMNMLNTPLPQVDLTHATAAAFCAIPCVLAKLCHGTPHLLTEHGIYLREQYITVTQHNYPSFLRSFLIRMIEAVSLLSYRFADLVAPVCRYNVR